ncbi:TonB-dependent receptor domain-containing protein [Duganella vulcania]|uniref:TonB-dependent receptor n=1 Tax=Duganella vulcania TaxID=2692166 RepID=A0A845GPA1_9BURK|nr:TonB-dependent receptor [Duganella vulcania]MYM95250.1 TonB-dependent receptor [Duganella vulcania]
MTNKKTMVAALAGVCAGAWLVPAAAVDVQDAGTVVVSATLREHNLASAPAFTTVLTADDIAKSPVNSLADLLRETVGVNNQSDGTGRDEIQIRGLAGKYTLMLVNGRRLSSGGALWRGSDFDFSSIPLNSIKRVEIVRGPMAALYGSDAVGGVINIITKTPAKDWRGTVSGEYRAIASGDQGDQYRLGASAAGAFNDALSLSIAAEDYDRKPWYSTSAADTTRPPRLEEKQSQNLVSTLTWKLSETQSLDFDFGYNKDKRPLGLYYYSYNPAWNYTSRDFRAQTITRNTYGVTHKALWSWGSTTAYLSHEDARVDDFNSRYNKPQQRVLKENNTYAKVYGSTEFGRHALTAGVDLRRQTVKDPLSYLTAGQSSTNTSAVFVEDEITLTRQLSLTLAGRDDHTAFGNHFTPKSYLVYQATPEWTVKGGVNQAFKAPDAYQLVKDYSIISCGGNCYLNGNPNLTPEKSTNYELGAEFHRKGLNASAVLFRNDVKDMIVSLYDPAGPSRSWANVAKARTSGVELQADAVLNAAFSVSGNYTRLNADYTDENGKDTRLDNRPRQMASAGVNWNAAPWLQASLSAHYTGEQFYQGGVLPGYTRVDVSASAKAGRNLTVRFGVKNLTDVELESKDKNFATFELGRNYYVSAAYAF